MTCLIEIIYFIFVGFISCFHVPVLILQSGRWRECAFTMDVSHQEEEEKDASLLRDEVTLIRQQQGR